MQGESGGGIASTGSTHVNLGLTPHCTPMTCRINYLYSSLLKKEAMSVKSISSWKFNRFLPAHNNLRTAIGKEVEWFADDPENSIGTIAFSKEEGSWNYAILRRDWMGDFQVCKQKANFRSLRATRIDCVLAMKAAEKSERRSFSEMNDA